MRKKRERRAKPVSPRGGKNRSGIGESGGEGDGDADPWHRLFQVCGFVGIGEGAFSGSHRGVVSGCDDVCGFPREGGDVRVHGAVGSDSESGSHADCLSWGCEVDFGEVELRGCAFCVYHVCAVHGGCDAESGAGFGCGVLDSFERVPDYGFRVFEFRVDEFHGVSPLLSARLYLPYEYSIFRAVNTPPGVPAFPDPRGRRGF